MVDSWVAAPVTDHEVDVTVGEILLWLQGQWSAYAAMEKHMADSGWPQEDVRAALEAFGARVGLEL